MLPKYLFNSNCTESPPDDYKNKENDKKEENQDRYSQDW